MCVCVCCRAMQWTELWPHSTPTSECWSYGGECQNLQGRSVRHCQRVVKAEWSGRLLEANTVSGSKGAYHNLISLPPYSTTRGQMGFRKSPAWDAFNPLMVPPRKKSDRYLKCNYIYSILNLFHGRGQNVKMYKLLVIICGEICADHIKPAHLCLFVWCPKHHVDTILQIHNRMMSGQSDSILIFSFNKTFLVIIILPLMVISTEYQRRTIIRKKLDLVSFCRWNVSFCETTVHDIIPTASSSLRKQCILNFANISSCREETSTKNL